MVSGLRRASRPHHVDERPHGGGHVVEVGRTGGAGAHDDEGARGPSRHGAQLEIRPAGRDGCATVAERPDQPAVDALAWVAILIDYAEIPVIYDTIRRVVVELREKRSLSALGALREESPAEQPVPERVA